jgi:methyl-accepting chemotaxis protein
MQTKKLYVLHSLKKDVLLRLAITAIVCAAVIVFIFLRHHIYYVSKHNVDRARLSALLAGSSIKQTLAANQPLSIEAALYDALSVLNDMGLPARALLYTQDGIVRAASDPAEIAKQAARDELDYITQLAEQADQHSTAVYVNKKTRVLHIYYPVKANGADLYILRFDAVLANMLSAIKQTYVLIISVLLLLGTAAAGLGAYFCKKIVTPIVLLNTAAKEIAEGDFNLRIDIQSADEIAELADTINSMSSALQKHALKKP